MIWSPQRGGWKGHLVHISLLTAVSKKRKTAHTVAKVPSEAWIRIQSEARSWGLRVLNNKLGRWVRLEAPGIWEAVGDRSEGDMGMTGKR